EPPKTNPKLVPYQQSFVLLKFFLAEDHTLTQAALENILRSKEIVDHLDFGSRPADAKSKSGLKMDSRLIGWVLQSLVQRGALRPEKHRNTVKYELTEEGKDLLGASDQYP